MPLYIRDDAVAARVQVVAGAKSKTAAVRMALEHELLRQREVLPISAGLARSLALADAMGTGTDDFDMKAWSDAMWGGR